MLLISSIEKGSLTVVLCCVEYKVVMVTGQCLFIEGTEVLLISSIVRSLTKDMELQAYERALALAIIFVGIWLGNLVEKTTQKR